MGNMNFAGIKISWLCVHIFAVGIIYTALRACHVPYSTKDRAFSAAPQPPPALTPSLIRIARCSNKRICLRETRIKGYYYDWVWPALNASGATRNHLRLD